MTSELRPAVEVWRDARDAWLSGNLGVGPNGLRLGNREAAAAVIEADREAVREQTVAKIVAWLRGDGESDWFDPDCADAIETGEWRANFDDHPLTSNQFVDHKTANMSDKRKRADR